MPIKEDRTHEYYEKIKYDFGMEILKPYIKSKELRHLLVTDKLNRRLTEFNDRAILTIYGKEPR